MSVTPGPWYVGAQNDALFIITKPPRPSNDDMADICDVQVIAKVNDCKGDEDAHVLAASREMLDALELIQGFNWQLDDSPHGQEIKRRALAAIAKAKSR